MDDKKEKEKPTKCSLRNKDAVMKKILGFSLADLSSFSSFVKLMNRPMDPASLGVFRCFYGFMMVIDVFGERGLINADIKWGSNYCTFPLFSFIKPLPLQWIYVVYIIMLLGAVGIMFGFLFRLSAACYAVTYWYIFLLDVTSWNNHSYLFGLFAVLILFSDANRYWSLDGLFSDKIRNSNVPLWNYAVFRFQLFILYFIAGLKKLDWDWVSGISMQFLSESWVFEPFKLFLTEEEVDKYIVHIAGLFIDLSLGFLLFFDQTRLLGFLIGSSFHTMNSLLFSIGLFPYICLGSQFIFCSPEWPRKVFEKMPSSFQMFIPENEDIKTSSHCLYSKEEIKSEEINNSPSEKQSSNFIRGPKSPTRPSRYHKIFSVLTIIYMSWQLFLPYSHGLTKGYNNWTNGMYGYSWDMMVHVWKIQHIRVTYVNKQTGEKGYLDPLAFVKTSRWTSHANLLKQYAKCFSDHLKFYNISDVELYFDIWLSLNYRFQQRIYDPRIDILSAHWSPFSYTPWVMPLLADLSDWRSKLEEIEEDIYESSNETQVVFVADFPGLYLENYVHEDLGNTSIEVLKGEVIVELVDRKRNITLTEGKSIKVPAGEFHNVHTISNEPSCYMYLYMNTTSVEFMKNLTEYEKAVNFSLQNKTDTAANEILNKFEKDPNLHHYKNALERKTGEKRDKKTTIFHQIHFSLSICIRSLRFASQAVYSIFTNSSFDDFLDEEYRKEELLLTAQTNIAQ